MFSLVVKMSTIRLVLGMVAAENLHLEQLDVKTAFLPRRVHCSEIRESSLQTKKELVWPKISSKTVVQEI